MNHLEVDGAREATRLFDTILDCALVAAIGFQVGMHDQGADARIGAIPLGRCARVSHPAIRLAASVVVAFLVAVEQLHRRRRHDR